MEELIVAVALLVIVLSGYICDTVATLFSTLLDIRWEKREDKRNDTDPTIDEEDLYRLFENIGDKQPQIGDDLDRDKMS